ncbi:MAG: hypothetical protein AAFO82_02710 [Bacteroidota bacterium]
MIQSQSTYHSKLYRAFKEIEATDYRTLVRFYEERLEAISKLDEDEYFELLFIYMSSLFELGAYAKFLKKVDGVIEIAILNNVEFFQGKDLFCELLFQKAAAHFQMMEYKQAEHTSRELLKIAPNYPEAALLLKKILRKSHPKFIKTIQASSVLLFLIAAAVIVFEILYVRHFQKEYIKLVEATRLLLLIGGILVFTLGELYLFLKAEQKVNRFIKEVKKRKGY